MYNHIRADMFRTEEPDYNIKVGIKDGKVVRVSWEDMIEYEDIISDPNKKITKLVLKYLRLAIKVVK